MDAATKSEERHWLNLRGIDAAKAGLALYIVGMLTSGLYYARFHILALDFTRIQSIVVGVYLVGIYLAAPAACVWLVRKLSRFRLVRVTACIVLLAGIDMGLFRLLHPSVRAFEYGVSTTLALQLILFVDWVAVWKSLLTRRLDFQLMHQPTRARLVVSAYSGKLCRGHADLRAGVYRDAGLARQPLSPGQGPSADQQPDRLLPALAAFPDGYGRLPA
jgi:hypothetical protein